MASPDMVMVPREPSQTVLERFVGHGLDCIEPDRPNSQLSIARGKWARFLEVAAAPPTAPVDEAGLRNIWSEEYAKHQLANKYGSLSFFIALDEAAIAAMRRVSRPSPPNTTEWKVTDEMVERAKTELLAHAICTEGTDANNRRLMGIAARAALTAALTPPPSNTGIDK